MSGFSPSITFFDTRLELLYAAAFVQVDGGPLKGNTNHQVVAAAGLGILILQSARITGKRLDNEHRRSWWRQLPFCCRETTAAFY